ncbi:hypothetical protein EWB00_007947, partial [Schistosoma japonicum]
MKETLERFIGKPLNRKRRKFSSCDIGICFFLFVLQFVPDTPVIQLQKRRYESNFATISAPSGNYLSPSLVKVEGLLLRKKSELSVSIEGDSELAKAVNQTTEQLESQSSPQEADDSDLEDGEGNKKRKKKRYATEHVDDTDKEPTNEKVNNLHPLTVLLTVSIPKNADIPLSEYDFSITLSFAWILNLNLVTVRLQFSLDKITPILRSKTGK